MKFRSSATWNEATPAFSIRYLILRNVLVAEGAEDRECSLILTVHFQGSRVLMLVLRLIVHIGIAPFLETG